MYNLYKFKYYHDSEDRTPEEKINQHQKIQSISNYNKHNFHLPEFINSDQKSMPLPLQDKISHILQQTNFQDGSFCRYTDNLNAQANFEIGNGKIAVLSIHGCPGNHKEWLRLEKSIGNNKIRWINLVVPGFDGADERRGNYKGDINDIGRLIIKLLNHLKIEQVIICGHSMGSYISYLFYQNYPNICIGIITLGGTPISWQIGMKAFYSCIVGQFGLENQKYFIEKSKTDEKFRKNIHQQFLQNRHKFLINQSDKQYLGQLEVAHLDENQFWAAYRLFGSSFNHSWDSVYENIRNVRPGLKFFAGGNNDIIIEQDLLEKTFYFFSSGQRSLENEIQYDKQQLIKLIQNCSFLNQFYNKFDFENIQNNFLYLYDNTGHPTHNRRGQELGQPILIYIQFLILFNQTILKQQDSFQRQQINPKL